MERRLYTDVEMESDHDDACWTWRGYCERNGYGRVTIARQKYLTHRLAWELAYGPIPEATDVLHRCDQPACCRPDHLFLGSQQENVRDMVRKERHPRGQRHGRARLTEEQVLEIIEAYHQGGVTQVELGRLYQVHHSLVSRIVRGQRWAHLWDREVAGQVA